MLFLETVNDFSDLCHWLQPLSESASGQSADFIIYRTITKVMFYKKKKRASNSVEMDNWLSFFSK